MKEKIQSPVIYLKRTPGISATIIKEHLQKQSIEGVS